MFRRTLHISKFGGFYKKCGILLETIIGDTYSITFGDGLVILKSQHGKIHEGKLKNWKMNRHESHTWSEGYKYEWETRILKKRSF